MTSDGFPHQDGSGLARLGHDGQVRPGLRHACLRVRHEGFVTRSASRPTARVPKGLVHPLTFGGVAPGHEHGAHHGACGKRWTAPCWAIAVRVHLLRRRKRRRAVPAVRATRAAAARGLESCIGVDPSPNPRSSARALQGARVVSGVRRAVPPCAILGPSIGVG